MSAAAIKPATAAERLAGIRKEMAALQAELWQDALAKANTLEAALNELDQEGMPEGVRQIARRLSEHVAGEMQSGAAIMNRRGA